MNHSIGRRSLLAALSLLLTSAAGLAQSGKPAAPSTSAIELDADRVFTDSQGQAVTGRVRGLEGGIVSIEKKGGGLIKARLSDLSLDDQTFIERWHTRKVLGQGRSFTFSAERVKEEMKRDKVMAVSRSVDTAFYRVKAKNLSGLALKDVRIVHRTYKRADSGVPGAGTERVYEEKEEFKQLWKPNEEYEFETAKQSLESSKLDSDFVYLDGKKRSTQDRLGGMWVRLYKDDVLIGEFAEPKALTQIESWDVPAAK